MKRFEKERKKYTKLLAQVLMDAGLPVVELVKSLEDPDAGWIHLFAARRGNTLKNRYKHGAQWPSGWSGTVATLFHGA